MRRATRAAAVVSVALVLLGGYFAWRWSRTNHWRVAQGKVDAATCPGAKTLSGDCAACVASECCAEVSACYSRADCIDLNDCWFKCGEGEGPQVPRADCPAACEKRHATAIEVFHRWDDCARSRCGAACPRDPDEDDTR